MRTTKEATTAWVAPLLSPPDPHPSPHCVLPSWTEPAPPSVPGTSENLWLFFSFSCTFLGLSAEISVTWSDYCQGSRGMRGTSELRIWFLVMGLNAHFLRDNWHLLRRMNTSRYVCAYCIYFLGSAYVHIHTLVLAHESHLKNQCNPPARCFPHEAFWLSLNFSQELCFLVLLKLHFWPGFYPTSFCQSNAFLNSLPFMNGLFDPQQPHPDLELWVPSGPMREDSVSRSCKASPVYFCLNYMFCICGEWWKLRLNRNERERLSRQSDPFDAFTERRKSKTRCRRFWRCLSARKKYLKGS